MNALTVPQKLRLTPQTKALCKRIGVLIDGLDQGTSILSYNVAEGWALTSDGRIIKGNIEPYWRSPPLQAVK